MADGLRESNKRRTRRAIRDAAFTLFLELGFDNISVRAISERAEISERTFYRYFDSKEEVLLADAGDYFSDVQEFLESRPPGESPMQSLLDVRTALEDKWTLDEEVVWLDSTIGSHPALRAQYLAVLYDHHDWLVGHFAARLDTDLTDPRPWLFAGAGVVAYQASVGMFIAGGARGSSWETGFDLLIRLRDGIGE